MQASDYTHCIANTRSVHLGMTSTNLFQFGAPSKACDLCSVDQAGLVLVLYTVKKALKYLENEHQVSAPPSQRPVALSPIVTAGSPHFAQSSSGCSAGGRPVDIARLKMGFEGC